MRKIIIAVVMGIVTASIGIFTATPAFAVENDVCHINALGINNSITVKQAVNQGGAIGFINQGECSRSKYGWGDTQQFLVPSGKKIKFWKQGQTGWQQVIAVSSAGWKRVADYCITAQCYVSIHNA